MKAAKMFIVAGLGLATCITGGTAVWKAMSPPDVTRVESRLGKPELGLQGQPGTEKSSELKADDPRSQRNTDRLEQLQTKLAALETTLNSYSNTARALEAQTMKAVIEEVPAVQSEDDQKYEREQEELRLIEQREIIRTQLEDRHAQQAFDPLWAGATEDSLLNAFDTSGLGKAGDLANVDCRSDMCILEFAFSPTEDGMPTPGKGVFSWLVSNAGDCGFIVEAAVPGETPDLGATQRVFLTDCT